MFKDKVSSVLSYLNFTFSCRLQWRVSDQ